MDFVSQEELMLANHASITPASHISVHVENVAVNNPMVTSVQSLTIALQVGVKVVLPPLAVIELVKQGEQMVSLVTMEM